MKYINVIYFFLIILFQIANAHASTTTVINAPQLKWAPSQDLPPGVEIAVLAGNPLTKSHFVARVKFPAHYIIPAHSHSIVEYDTVISGTYYLGDGAVADANKGIPLRPGDFAAIPAHSSHYGFTKEPTIIQISSDGPWGMIYHCNG